MLDNGSMQDGDDNLRATARLPVARVSATVYDALGPSVTVTGDRGSVTLPAVIAEMRRRRGVAARQLERPRRCSPTSACPAAP